MLKLSNIEKIVEDARNGKLFVLVDDENRENEGDLIFPAKDVSAEKINFMAKHGRGLICLALNTSQSKKLNLNYMSPKNESRNQTAFTVSIEAKKGISTGISAKDRATTIKVATKTNVSKKDIVSPGHVFPIVAKDGGVLELRGAKYLGKRHLPWRFLQSVPVLRAKRTQVRKDAALRLRTPLLRTTWPAA